MEKKLIKILIKNSLILHFAFCILNFTSTSHAQVEAPKNPDSAKECALCHYNWVDTFFVYLKGSDLVEYTSEKVAAKPELCFSCHDGSVVDSRARVYNDHRHKINQPPPPSMKIPKIFPLDEKGNMQCATCHTAHGVSSEMGIEKTIFIRTSNDDSAMCRMCHTDKDGGIEAGNHPIGPTKMEIPRRNYLIAIGSQFGTKNQIICETCHTAHGSPNESLLIESARNSHLCLECHTDKNVLTPEGERKPIHVVNIISEKVTIPDELIKKGAKLGYDGEIICQTCHKMHNNKIEEHLLVIKKDKQTDLTGLCLTCHKDKQYIADTKHNLIHSAPQEKNLEGKIVAETGICSACHLVHKPARKINGKGDITTQLCLSCHSKGNIAEKTFPAEYTHPLNVKPFEKDKDIVALLFNLDVKRKELTLPLFNKFGVRDEDGEIKCITCHDPHRWRPDSTKGEISKDVKGDNTTSFLRKASPEICRECHSDKFYIANTKHDINKVAPEERNILNQNPSESGLCGSCHVVHGGQKDFLWAGKITTKSENAAQNLCVNCHNENGMAKKKVVKDYSHPINISPLEKGLTTTLPLFDKDGKIFKNGIMTCQTCHDPHRWDPVRVISGDFSDIEGNAQNSFLRLENSPESKLCENCHADKTYVEKSDHDLIVTEPSSKNIIGELPAESGTCGVCHLAHNSKNKLKLWARSYESIPPDESIMNALCLSCHSKGNSAEKKTVRIASHPSEKLIDNIMRKNKKAIDYFPIYDKDGKEITTGNISCPSCHNAHQWSLLSKQKGTGKNIEGNATNSFLRNLSYNNICIDCHGLDALFRFKYYHEPSERKGKGVGVMFKK